MMFPRGENELENNDRDFFLTLNPPHAEPHQEGSLKRSTTSAGSLADSCLGRSGSRYKSLLNERPGGALDAPETVTAKLCKGSRVFLISQRNCLAGDGQGSCVRYGHGVLGNLGFGFSAHARVFM